MNIDEYIMKIKNELKLQGYSGKKIDYLEFKSLYQKYGEHMTEKEFANNFLEMTYDQYDSLKKGRYKAIILKKQLSQTIHQDVEKIKTSLCLEGYCGKLIDYTELQRLHKLYAGHIPENKFAKIVLELNETSYRSVKSGKRKVRILKSLQNKALEDIEQIKQILQNQGYEGKVIDYKELQMLHQTYGKLLTETQFAQKVLELNSSTYLEIKNYGKKARILKKSMNQELKESIERTKILLAELGYAGKVINYTEFQFLHKMYGGEMPEYQFARDVLEINNSTYKINLKKHQKNATILKSRVDKIPKYEIQEILRNQQYVGKLIDYEELQTLHQQYGCQIPESQFAQEVLEISVGLYRNIKANSSKKAAILKSLIIELDQEEIDAIQEKLEGKGIAGSLINYEELQWFHRQYGSHMGEADFAQQVLEISSDLYREMKKTEYETQILCNNKKVELIHSMLLKESRWYTKDELEKICNENAVSMDRVIRQVISNGTNIYNECYKRVLEEKGKLWIGRVSMAEYFLEQNIDLIAKLARVALYSVKKRFCISQNSEDEDFIQDAIIWLSQNGGEIEKNFSDYPEIMKRKIFNTIRKGITIKVLLSFETTIKTISLNKKMRLEKGYERELESRIASSYDLEAHVIEKIDEEVATDSLGLEAELAVKCVKEMKRQVECGLTRECVLNNIKSMFGISEEKLLELMQLYLLENGTVKISNYKSMDGRDLGEK